MAHRGEHRYPEQRRRRGTVLAILGGVLASGVMIVGSTYSAFTSSTNNASDAWATGTVTVSDDDAGKAMFTTSAASTGQVSTAGMAPGTVVQNCITVSYTGSLASTVRLYDAVTDTNGNGGTGTALSPYLHVKIEEGTGGSFGSCTGFTGGTVLWDSSTPASHVTANSDVLGVVPTTWAAGIVSPTSWTTSTSRTYRFTVTVDGSTPDTSQGATATATFTWEARNA